MYRTSHKMYNLSVPSYTRRSALNGSTPSRLFFRRATILSVCLATRYIQAGNKFPEENLCIRRVRASTFYSVASSVQFVASREAVASSRKHRATRYIRRAKPEAFLSRRSLTRTTASRKSPYISARQKTTSRVHSSADIVFAAIIRRHWETF